MKRTIITALISFFILQGVNGQFISSSQTIGSGTNQLDISVMIDAVSGQAKFEITGPSTVWFGFSFNTTTMSPGSYTILANVSGGNPAEYIMVNHAAPTLQPVQNLTSITSSVAGGRKTFVFYRNLSTGDANDYIFQTTTGNLNIAWAYGNSLAMGYHANRGGSSLNFTDPCSGVPPYNLPPISICSGDSAMIFGQYRSVAGTYSQSYPIAWACDSVVNHTLIVNNPIFDTLPALHICSGDSIMIFGQYRYLSGNYSLTLQSSSLCDSTIIQPLIVSSGGVFFDTSHINLCQGDSIYIHNQWVHNQGFYSGFSHVAGCDSIYDVYAVTHTIIDTAISVIGQSLNAVPGYDKYQWFNCSTGQPAPGSINSNVYTPLVPGTYRVEITQDSCVASSGCYPSGITGIERTTSSEIPFDIYPNPASTHIYIKFKDLTENGTISMVDFTGKIILSENILQESSIKLNTENIAPGRYQIFFTDKGRSYSGGIIIR